MPTPTLPRDLKHISHMSARTIALHLFTQYEWRPEEMQWLKGPQGQERMDYLAECIRINRGEQGEREAQNILKRYREVISDG